MPHLFVGDTSHLVAGHSEGMRNVLLGFVLSSFPLAMFFGSSMIGSLSDKIGRKKTLLLCLVGNSVGFTLAFFSLLIQSVSLLFIGRILSGLFSGSVPVAQAAIIDLTTPDKKAKHLAFSSVANGIGFAVGPALGGVLSAPNVAAWSNFGTPFLFCSILILVNMTFLCCCFKDTYQGNPNQIIDVSTGIKNIYHAFSIKETRALSLIFLLYILGYFGFMQYVSIYLAIIFQQSSAAIGYFLAYYSLCFVISLVVLFPRIIKVLPLNKTLMLSLILQPLMVALFVSSKNIIFCWGLIGVMAIPFSFCYVALTTMFSNIADATEQGKMMGVAVSLFAFAWGIIPSVSGILQNITNTLPMFSFIALLAGSLLIVVTSKFGSLKPYTAMQ
jgi:MFS family permease